MESEFVHKVFSVTDDSFNVTALDIFHFQYLHNALYRSFVDALGVLPASVLHFSRIPFLPIHFFKTHEIKTSHFLPERVFESSGTTGSQNSRHFVKHTAIYRESFMRGFEKFYGPPRDWCIIGLLPSYLERSHSSLVLMADELIKASDDSRSGFYLYDHDKLAASLRALESEGKKTLLIGVTFALLNFAEGFAMNLQHTVVMETGGMKGRREEMTREEIHHFLQERLGTQTIHSEYGMTELLSQAYSTGAGLFHSPPWLKILLREEDDPLQVHATRLTSLTGAINIIDLANIYSCSFIATDDLGRLHPGGGFEVLGRMDASDIRGCSLMVV